MNRGAGMGLMVFGIVLVVVGAIMRYAVTAKASEKAEWPTISPDDAPTPPGRQVALDTATMFGAS